jgi:hypothetical protein
MGYIHTCMKNNIKIDIKYIEYGLSFSMVYWLSYLALDTRFAGSNQTEYDGFLMEIKISSMNSFGGEVKPSVPCRKILRNVKYPC